MNPIPLFDKFHLVHFVDFSYSIVNKNDDDVVVESSMTMIENEIAKISVNDDSNVIRLLRVFSLNFDKIFSIDYHLILS